MIELSPSVESNIEKGSVIWEKELTVSASETSDWVGLPDNAGKVELWLISLIPTGTARVEITSSSKSRVVANTAIAYQWDDGDVSINTIDTLEAVSAVRVVSVTGAATIEVRVV